MSKIVEYLNDAGVYYLATVDGDQPRVRPFGATAEFEGRIYFCTNNKKDVYKQLSANQNVEISGMAKNGSWIRISGKAVVDNRDDAQKAMLAANPALAGIYKAGDGVFEVFYLDNMTAKVFSFRGEPVELK